MHYERDPGPTKLPAGAIEIPVSSFGAIDFIQLHLDNALCEIRWKQGTILEMFIDATQPAGHFRFRNLMGDISILFDLPSFMVDTTKIVVSSVSGQDLAETVTAMTLKQTEITIRGENLAGRREHEAAAGRSVDQSDVYDAENDITMQCPDYFSEAKRWKKVLGDFPPLIISDHSSLMIADRLPYTSSHRHLSHLTALHPLGLIDGRDNQQQRKIYTTSVDDLRQYGPGHWCGYSYAWYGNLLAWAGQGDLAADALRIFATCFCLPNSFHVNVDQFGTGKSEFTYRPFTLEGNFALAAAIQEMLIQSQGALIRVFPAIPGSWKDCSFRVLRAQGAFLVSAVRSGGEVKSLEILA